MTDYVCIITCPKCGTVLFRSQCVGTVVSKCPKCSKTYEIEQSGSGIQVREAKASYKAGSR